MSKDNKLNTSASKFNKINASTQSDEINVVSPYSHPGQKGIVERKDNLRKDPLQNKQNEVPKSLNGNNYRRMQAMNQPLDNMEMEGNVDDGELEEAQPDELQEDIVQPEEPQVDNVQQKPNEPLNTISNSVNSLRNGAKKGESLSDKVQSLRNRNRNMPLNSGDESPDKANHTGAKEKVAGAKDKIENKVAGKAIQAATGGAVSGKVAEKLAAEAKAMVKKRMKRRAVVIGVAIGILFFIVLASILMNEDDESLTSLRTNDFVMDESTEEAILEYMGYIAICPSVKEGKAKAEEKGLELEDGKLTFNVMRELATFEDVDVSPTCLNAMDFYEFFRLEYVENKKACYYNRTSSEELPDYFRHPEGESAEEAFLHNEKSIAYFIGHKDDYDCQIKLPTELIFETMSYDLTDHDLFNKDYEDRENYIEYKKDLRKLANALSEYMQETCFKWKYKDRETGEIHDSPCGTCDRVKVPYDGFYFQISFDKYVCYLKYGDTCSHPNYANKPRQKFPDKQYLKHLCTSPENDKLMKLENDEGYDPQTEDYEIPADTPLPDEPLQDGSGSAIVQYAMQFLGNPYKFGGTSLTDGIDCSGFVMAIYQHFGVSLPHSSGALRSKGQSVASLAEAKAGDIICYSGHVGIYMGDGRVIHASGKASGIKISNNAAYRQIVAIRRIVE